MNFTRRTFLVLTGAAASSACGQVGGASGSDGSLDDVSDAVADDRATADGGPPDVTSDGPTPDTAVDAQSAATDAPATDAGADDASTLDAQDPQDVAPDGSADVSDDVPVDASSPDASDASVDASADVSDASSPDVSDASSPDATLMIPELGAAFPLGLMAGDMDATSAVLWTRYTGAATLLVRVERMEGGRPVEVALEREVTPGAGGFTHVLAEGLRPGARYRLAFLIREGARLTGRSPTAKFRTALADGALEPVLLGATSCTNARYRPFAPLQRVGEHGELDGFVHLGDLTYCDGARTIDEFRAKYAENYTSDGFRRMFREAGFYSTWDDHEVTNNWDPERIDRALFATARQAYFEHRAQRRHPTDPDRIWRSFRWGATLELFILDARGERRPSTRTSSGAVYLSRAQMDWLKDGLARSTARFKIIANSVPIADMPFTFLGGDDRWEGYAAARNEVLDHITGRGIRGVWWLSGDFHLGAVGRLETSGARGSMRDLIVGPGGQFPNPLFLSLLPPQFDFTTGENNYVTLRADPSRNELTVRFINGGGRVIFERVYPNA